jgi:hypothetical protein
MPNNHSSCNVNNMHTPSASARLQLPYSAAEIAAQAKEYRGEFDAATTTEFPVIKYSQPIFGGNSHAPSAWTSFIRVTSDGSAALVHLYVALDNQSNHGLVSYNRAALPGGAQLRVDHIRSDTVNSLPGHAPYHWIEDLAVELDADILAAHLNQALRVQISRPDEGLSFVVEIPSHYVAAVLYRLAPTQYEFEQAPQLSPQQQQVLAEQALNQMYLKKTAWVGAVAVVLGMWFDGFFTGIGLGVAAMGCAIALLKKMDEKRAHEGQQPQGSAANDGVGRHYLRSPSDRS